MKHIETIFSLLLAASLASTVILLLPFLIRSLFDKRLNPRIVHALWFLALIKLLIPIAPQSSISLFNLMPQAMPNEWISQPKISLPEVSSTSDSGSNAILIKSEEENPIADPVPNPTEQPSSSIGKPSLKENPYENIPDGLNWLKAGSLIWLGGFLILGLYSLFVTLRFRTRIRSSRKIDNEEVLSVMEACKEKLGIIKSIPVYETSNLHSPCISGLTKPKIYLPEDIVTIADSRQLTHILLHELTHYKRKDLWLNSLWTLSIWIHWYNPLVWLAARKAKADREIACDAGVLEVLGERESSSYGMTLLMLSRLFARRSSPRVNLSHFFERKNEMKRRITMIANFKKGSYKLSAAAVLLVLSLSAVLLTNASETAKSADSGEDTRIGSKKLSETSFKIVRPNDFAKWFHSLDRATDFSGFDFKVPDYLPEGYRLQNIDILEKYVKRADDLASVTFVSNFGEEDEQIIEMVASKGNLLETHDWVWGTGNIAPYSWGAAQALTYRHDLVTIGHVKGTLVTQTQGYKRHEPEIAKSFLWQDEGVWYAINYYSENHTLKEGVPYNRRNISQDELGKIAQSFVLPQQIRQVSYDGEGNSFPLYDETDLLKAKNILGFQVKFPLALPDTGLTMIDSFLLKAGDQNTGFSFRAGSDALWNAYRAPYDSTAGYDLNDELSLYQSRDPLFDTAKLSLIRTLDINGIEISAYADNDHVYFGPSYYSSNGPDKKKARNQTYYLWKQDDIYYSAIFLGMDKNQEENVKALILAPAQ